MEHTLAHSQRSMVAMADSIIGLWRVIYRIGVCLMLSQLVQNFNFDFSCSHTKIHPSYLELFSKLFLVQYVRD